MIIVFKKSATKEEVSNLISRVESLGLKVMLSEGSERKIMGIIGPEDIIRMHPLDIYPGVDKVMQVLAPYKLVSREFKSEDSIVKVKEGVEFGSEKIVVVAGPCSIESKEQLRAVAKTVKFSRADILRGGAFKPRTSPYAFQGLGEEGLRILEQVGTVEQHMLLPN